MNNYNVTSFLYECVSLSYTFDRPCHVLEPRQRHVTLNAGQQREHRRARGFVIVRRCFPISGLCFVIGIVDVKEFIVFL